MNAWRDLHHTLTLLGCAAKVILTEVAQATGSRRVQDGYGRRLGRVEGDEVSLRATARTPLALPPDANALRASAVRLSKNNWVNGTVLHYCFMQRPGWDWPDQQKDVVHWALEE